MTNFASEFHIYDFVIFLIVSLKILKQQSDFAVFCKELRIWVGKYMAYTVIIILCG